MGNPFTSASGKYKNMTMFQDEFDEFIVAASKEDLKAKIIENLNIETNEQPILSQEIIRKYFGYFDGKTVDRMVQIFENEIKNQPSGRTLDWFFFGNMISSLILNLITDVTWINIAIEWFFMSQRDYGI